MTGAIDIRAGLSGVIAIVVLAAAFAIPTQAFAQENCSNANSDPTAAQYCSPSNVLGEGESEAPTTSAVESAPAAEESARAAPVSEGGSLPFTGLDVGILALAAAALTGAGLLLRRLTAPGAPRG